MTIEIVSLAAGDMARLYKPIVEIYESVFTLPPYNEPHTIVRQFARTLPQQVEKPGFVIRIALDGDLPIGMAYGATCSTGQWFHSMVTRDMSERMISLWFANAFEIIELAVRPDYQGQGIGSRLHDQLLADLPHSTSVLSTMNVETPARHLYRKRGWQPIRDKFVFPSIEREYLILGLQLPLL